MHKTCVFVLAFLLLEMQPAVHSAVTKLVVDIPTRPGALVRVLYNAPNAPIAHLIPLPGSSGVVRIQPDGSIPSAPPDAQARIAGWVAAGVARGAFGDRAGDRGPAGPNDPLQIGPSNQLSICLLLISGG
jgi:hypothetical protein